MAAIFSLKELDDEIKAALSASIRAGDYNLFLGAGVSLDSKNSQNENLPTGTTLKLDLCKITGANEGSSLQRVFSGLNENQIEEHVTRRFSDCSPGETVCKIPSFIWRRIFTLNIDNALEEAYKRPGNLQEPRIFHFKDSFEELRSLERVPIVHLHGYAQEPEKGYVFASTEYARLMAEANAWMTVLADIMPTEPFIIAGTSLDEIDLEFYLARRSSISFRDDRGPSFRIEPFPDQQTEADCNRHGLILYKGDFLKFCSELNLLVPRRTGVFDLVNADTRGFFPAGAPKSVVMSFSNDFDIVPRSALPSVDAAKFSYGYPPSWNDLAGNWDVGRPLTRRIRAIIDAIFRGDLPNEILIVLDDTGVGKTTVLRRIAYDLSAAGVLSFNCTALSRIDPRLTAEAIDLIDHPIVIFIDDFAEQAPAISTVFAALEKRDVIFVCAERGYRQRHLVRSLGDVRYRFLGGLNLGRLEARQLVDSYVQRGQAGTADATRRPDFLASRIENEPIAVACCHILNDMRPIDAIVQSTYDAASEKERHRYLVASLAHYCFGGGIRYEVLASLAGREKWNEQFVSFHPLPLEYFDKRRNFIVPLNATIAERALVRVPAEDVFQAFQRLAMGIAPRVNRDAIRYRSPEARLAGRLFDYDDVVSRFLGSRSGNFYTKVQRAWQWNSRYWEQVALYKLAKFKAEEDEMMLRQAVQHARHAVSIEDHPFPLTTLGKVLLAQLGVCGVNNALAYEEAFRALVRAIDIEHRRARASVHAYVTLFHGTLDYLKFGGELSVRQCININSILRDSIKYFPRDLELKSLAEHLQGVLIVEGAGN